MTSSYFKKLEHKRVLIFGGTSGIGFAVAEALIEHGASIVIAGSSSESLGSAFTKLLASDLASDATAIKTVQIDLSQSANLEQTLPEVLKEASDDGKEPIDHIVWTAGNPGPIYTDLDAAKFSTIQSAMAIRLIGPALLGHVLVATEFKYFNKSALSSITFTGGAGTAKAVIRMVGGGLEGLVQGLAVELSPIRVNVVHPGLTLTEKMVNRLPPQALESAKKATLTQRLAEPEDMAEAYLYSIKNNAVTGQALISNAGKTITR